jgi:hypothetical protein
MVAVSITETVLPPLFVMYAFRALAFTGNMSMKGKKRAAKLTPEPRRMLARAIAHKISTRFEENIKTPSRNWNIASPLRNQIPFPAPCEERVR